MKIPLLLGRAFLAGMVVSVLLPARSSADDWGHNAVAISSRTSPDYHRVRLPDGHYRTEAYVVAKGGFFGGTSKDESMERATFPYIVKTIAGPLGRQGYVPVGDEKRADLLLMIYWGSTSDLQKSLSGMPTPDFPSQLTHGATTHADSRAPAFSPRLNTTDSVASGFQLDDYAARVDQDHLTMALLGYDDLWASVEGYQGTVFAFKANDVLDEVERPRYLVALLAYDYRLMRAQKKAKLVWETRYSVDLRGHDFDKDLPAMTLRAASYFGKDSHGVLHDDIPEGHVEVGEPRTIGIVDH
ncbi:MAG TPA: hypothetical protein VGL42_13130 [Opitutaceae bacterium]|jgi:hypothetical protein